MTHSTAETARRLLLSEASGVLSTMSQDCPGFPFGSVVPIGFDYHHRPILQISRLAQHTRNIDQDAHVSLLVSNMNEVGLDDVQTCARLTVLGLAKPLEKEAAIRRYYRYYSKAKQYHQELDFDFYYLEPHKIRFIGGFGKIHWVEPAELFCDNPFDVETEESIVEHMNSDHRDALRHYAEQAGVDCPDEVTPKMVGVDAEGFHIRIKHKLIRCEFNQPARSANEVRQALIALLN